MKERGILMSAPMSCALLAGTKTQTRRAVKPQPSAGDIIQRKGTDPGWIVGQLRDSENAWREIRCPYGVPGDRLWVREACWIYGQWHEDGKTRTGKCRWRFKPIGQRVRFDNPGHEQCAHWGKGPGWSHRPSIHMPRWASRILLEITEVRVERLRDISEEDARAEGMSASVANSPRVWYMALWSSINGPDSWDANPWVWVVAFRRIAP
ncbi:hypothetical protein [Ramlibacter sp.]|uniref:hypothetical protein n=1 Tax=Ramlibacter sp. TaxID=1917967 RepID=UPI003D0FA91A